ncbi:hypothetical protein TNCV_1701861 [Trichonephila clavipes]|nr:hypothetical protein TNCV_1701861 [Trichonephila clavipes]
MKQDLEKAENAYLSSFTSKKSKTLPTAAAHGDPNGKNDYQKKDEFDKGVWVIDTAATSHFCNDKSLFLDLKPITNMKMSLATEDKSCPVEGIGTLRFRPDHYIIPKSKEISFFSDVTAKTKNGSIEIWHQRFCHVNNDYLVKTSKNDSVKGLPRLTDNEKIIPNPRDFQHLSEQQEALMVEVTIPNCYKQVIRSRDASKWHDAMDKEINVMKERKVWDLVDHPDNIKILENRWVYTIKYDENNKIVRYKARLVARGNTQLRGESFDEVFQEYKLELSKVKSLKLRCYSDSDFATNRDDRVSMGGFITFIDETPISSRTFKQNPLVCRPWKLSMLV